MIVALLRRSLSRVRGVTLGVAALLVGFQLLVVVVASEQEDAQSFELMMRLAPSFLQRQLGPAMPLLMSFQGFVTFGYFHPVVVLTVALVAALIASELAGDVEAGYVDLLLSRPMARHWLVTRSLLLTAVLPGALAVVMMATTWIALAAFAPSGARWPSAITVASLAARLVGIAWCFGALALALGGFVRRRAGALAPTAITAVSLYLIELLAGAWRPIRRAGSLSPFHYYQGTAVLTGSADLVADLTTLLAMTLPLVALAYWQFSRRDV
jgi:ABC-2 type transport system permease protein